MKKQVTALVEAALSGVIPLISLRGSDELARDGGDLDFLVPAKQAIQACILTAAAAQRDGWHLVGFRDIGYLAQIFIIKPVADGNDLAIKIDFFSGISWYGAGSDPVGARLFDLIDGCNCTALAGAAGFFQKMLIVGKLSDRDFKRVVAAGADPKFLEATAKRLGLPLTSAHIERRELSRTEKWVLRARSAGVAGTFEAGIWFMQVSLAHLKFKFGFGTKADLILGVSGLDGSGKSTLIDRFLTAYATAGGLQPKLVHLLPAWIPMPHQILRRASTKSNYTRPYSSPPVRSKVNGALRLGFYLIAFAVARTALHADRARGNVIILDRSFLDFSADLTRARIPDWKIPQWLLKLLMPSGALFYLDASPANVVARKGELSLEKATSLRDRYMNNSKIAAVRIIDGNTAPDAVFELFLSEISAIYMTRLQQTSAER